MKYLLIISCLLFTSVGWSKDISLDDLIEKDGLYYEKFTEKPFTGKVTGIKKGKIHKGIKKGKWIEYWESGTLKENYTIKRGKRHGEYLKYYLCPRHDILPLLPWAQREVCPPHDTLPSLPLAHREEGEEKVKYYENGQSKEKSIYNGQLYIKGNYKYDKQEGEYLVYYENGQLKYKWNFKDGKQYGEQLHYHENGQLKIKGNYKDGIEEGEFLIYDKNGKLEKTRIYKDDKLIDTITH